MQRPHYFDEFLGYLTSHVEGGPIHELARAVAWRAALGMARDYRRDCAHHLHGDNGVATQDYNRVEATIEAARQVREYAYAPYSAFRVGAAVLSADGTIVSGTNIESSSYGLTLCAERAALAAAWAKGVNTILLVCVVADTVEPISPCGACRQWIIELAPWALVGMVSLNGKERWCTAKALLPFAFDSHMFNTKR